jgi:hypothetical protein
MEQQDRTIFLQMQALHKALEEWKKKAHWHHYRYEQEQVERVKIALQMSFIAKRLADVSDVTDDREVLNIVNECREIAERY